MNSDNVPPLRTLFLHATNYCNLKCKHCWINPIYTSDSLSTKNDVSLSTVKSVVEQAMPMGLRNIKITGGEPFLREDLLDFIEYFSNKKLSVSIETNGMLLTEETVKALKGLHVSLVAVSLDGKGPESHDSLRGVPGAYEKALKGIKLLRRFKVTLEIVSVLHKENLSEIEDMIKLSDGLGARIHKINPIAAVGRGQKMSYSGKLLSIPEILALNNRIENDWQQRFSTKIELDVPVAFKSIDSVSKVGFCKCGIKNMVGLLANGKLALCGIGENVEDLAFGFADDIELQDMWRHNKILNQIRVQIPLELEGICRTCLMKHYCLGRCRANVFYSTGSITGPFAFCEEAYQLGLFPNSRIY